MYNGEELLKQLGLNIKAERVRKNYTQESFAEILGVTREYVSRIERGKENLSFLKVINIANVLNTDINSILRF